MTILQTVMGAIDLENISPDDIHIEDIATALSRTVRYRGMTRVSYSVAAHCVNMCEMADPAVKLEALMHDAAEAYISDIPSPVKQMIGSALYELEEKIERAIAEKFGLVYPWPKQVKELDLHMLYLESRVLFKKPHSLWDQFHNPMLPRARVRLTTGRMASNDFLFLFKQEFAKRQEAA